MLIAFTQADLRAALVYVGAAQGGLALFVAASGVKPVVWLGLLALTPLRLLLFLAADAAQGSDSPTQRRTAVCLFALGGLALAALGLLTTWWAREAGAALDALLVAEAAVALTGVWAARAARRLLIDPKGFAKPLGSLWLPIGLLGVIVLTGGLAFRPLARHLAIASRMALPAIPTLPALLRYAATAPALVVVMALVLAVWRLLPSLSSPPLGGREGGAAEEVYNLEEGLSRVAQVLHAVVEVGIAEQIIALAVRAVVNGARVTYWVEHRGLEGLLRASVRTVVDGAHVTHRVVEHEGLEGLIRRAVRTVLVLSHGLQRWHTGRLQRNLLWVTVSLALAVLIMVLYGG